MDRMYKKSFILAFLLLLTSVGQGQSVTDMVGMIDYTKFKLPPLETLFENAKKSPGVEMYEAKMEAQDNLLITEKRSWLKYFRVGGSWQYGNIAINSAFTNEYTPLFYQTAGETQNSWYSTAGVSIPLDDLFDRKNRVKRQKMERRFTELEMEKWLDEQRIRIVNSYMKIQNGLATLQKKAEEYNVAASNYRMAENEFKLGNATVESLNAAKRLEVLAYESLKGGEYAITTEILTLEILSKTNIISP